MPPYQYKPLQDASIRILELFPGESDDPLKGCIGHRVFIPEWRKHRRWVPIYEALSYAWGEQDDLKILTVVDDSTGHETVLQIGKNLALALRDLRKTSESRTIWCDAVCINQHDLAERAAQVQRMADIYRHADRVVVWLASKNDHLSHAMRILDEIGSHVGNDFDKAFCYIHEGMDKTYLDRDYLLPFSIDDWQCIVSLASLPWFTRLWVRQEIALANNSAIVISGKHQMPWSKLSSAVMYLDMKLKRLQTVVIPAPMQLTTAIFRNVWELLNCKNQQDNSMRTVELQDGCECADPRDRIYGILGLQNDLDIHIDYEKSVKEVYTDWVLVYYRKHSTLSFLEMCEMASSPSWVPDLDKPRSLQLKRVHSRSGGNTKAVFRNLSDGLCEMQGTRCGIIKQQTSTMSQELDLGVIQRTLESWVHQFFPRGIQSQSHEGLAMNDLAATISCGRAIEHYDLGRFSMLDAESALLQENKEPSPSKDSRSPIAPVLLAELNHLLPGAAIFATNEGHFGSGSGAARIGDEIFVVLGCDFPLVMRHVEDSKYSIVGPCYVPRLSHGEAVLGPLPNGWKMLFDGRGLETFTAPDGSHTLEDPRLEMDLPPGWEQKQKSNRSYLTWKRTEDNTWRIFDPRQTPEKLEARGIKLEMITVV